MTDKERDSYSSGPTHRFVETNGIRMHLTEQGEGPLVLLCHGFPESWYSWRHQVSTLWPPICAAMVRRIDQRPSTNTRFFIWSVIWLGYLMPWATKRR